MYGMVTSSPLIFTQTLTSRRGSRVRMTEENWMSQMGIASKQLTERYAEYPAAAHDQQLFYTYEPSSPSHGHMTSSKHHYSSGGHKNNAAMSALTLLAFLFFLHILQQCLKEHMTAMSTPQVMVVSAGREGEQNMAKMTNKNKLDKAGLANKKTPNGDVTIKPIVKIKNEIGDGHNAHLSDESRETFLMKIQTEEHTPHNI